MLPVRLLVNSRLLFWGSQKLHNGFLTVGCVGNTNPALFWGQLCILNTTMRGMCLIYSKSRIVYYFLNDLDDILYEQ